MPDEHIGIRFHTLRRKAEEMDKSTLVCPNCTHANTKKDSKLVEVVVDQSGLMLFCNSCGRYAPLAVEIG